MQPSTVVAAVAGGNDQSFLATGHLVLNASMSYDNDLPNAYGAAAGLSFLWTCKQLVPTLRPDCSDIFSIASMNSSAIDITFTGVWKANIIASVTLTVFSSASSAGSSAGTGRRSSATTVTVTVLSPSSPVVAIPTDTAVISQNPSKSLVLTGSVSLYTKGTVQWFVNDPSLSLAAVSLVPTQTNVTATKATQLTSYLALRAGALSPRVRYTFSLRCVLANGMAASASVVVATIGPPIPGVFLVTPAKGIEISTTFSFSASQWTDENLPLSYAFSFFSPNSANIRYATVQLLPVFPRLFPVLLSVSMSGLICLCVCILYYRTV